MPQYYHNIITEKSWQFLQEFRKSYNFILIGGWAVFLHARALKSKDIDVIIDYKEMEKLKQKFNIIKNDRLKKYEIKHKEFDIDIYLPYYSDLGIDIEEVIKRKVSRQGFAVPEVEILFMLKLYAWNARRLTVKGQKDEIDIFSLITLPGFNWKKYLDYTRHFGFEKYNKLFMNLVKTTREVKELQINQQAMSKIKKKILNLTF